MITSFINFIKSFKVFVALFLKMNKTLLLLALKNVALKDLTLKDGLLLLLLISKDLLISVLLALILVRYKISFMVCVMIIKIEVLYLKSIVIRRKTRPEKSLNSVEVIRYV